MAPLAAGDPAGNRAPRRAGFWIGAIRVAGYLEWMGLSARGDSWRPDGV